VKREQKSKIKQGALKELNLQSYDPNRVHAIRILDEIISIKHHLWMRKLVAILRGIYSKHNYS